MKRLVFEKKYAAKGQNNCKKEKGNEERERKGVTKFNEWWLKEGKEGDIEGEKNLLGERKKIRVAKLNWVLIKRKKKDKR